MMDFVFLLRYACGHCKATFWNQALVRNHHARGHKDLPYSIEENFVLDLTPEFWSTEYGLPLNMKTRGGKKSVVRNSNHNQFLQIEYV